MPSLGDRAYNVYCDGASRKDKRGGWGYAVFEGVIELFSDCGGFYNTTNNRMELTAAIRALRALPQGSHVTIYCDSKYVIDGITEYYDTWVRAGWLGSGAKPVKNRDLWESLHLQARRHSKVAWKHVKGHTGVYGNELADVLAGEGVPEKRA